MSNNAHDHKRSKDMLDHLTDPSPPTHPLVLVGEAFAVIVICGIWVVGLVVGLEWGLRQFHRLAQAWWGG